MKYIFIYIHHIQGMEKGILLKKNNFKRINKKLKKNMLNLF